MTAEEYKRRIYCFVQQIGQAILGCFYELIGKTKELAGALGTQVTAIAAGFNGRSAAGPLRADQGILVDDPAHNLHDRAVRAWRRWSPL